MGPQTALSEVVAARTATSHPRRWWILAALCVALLVIGLDGTVLNVALSDISVALGATTSQLQWVLNGYLLSQAVLLIPCGVLGDRVGRGSVLAGGLFVFGVASAAGAWAGSPGQLIAARVAMGVGAATVLPLSLSIVATVFPAAERRRAVSVVTAAMGIGMPLGPLLGGWLLERFWWGSTLLINVPVVAVSLVACLVLVPNLRAAGADRLDLVGMVLAAGGFGLLVFGLVEAPTDGWGSATVVLTLASAAVLLVTFLLVEHHAVAPLVPRALSREPMFVWPTVAIAGASFVILGVLFVVPQYLQVVGGHDAFGTGLRLMPMMVALAFGAGLADRIGRVVPLTALIMAGFALVALGFAPLVTLDVDGGYVPLLAALVGIGCGFGLAVPPAMDTMLGSLPENRESTATSLNTAVKQLASALGVAILGSLVNAAYGHGVGPALAGLDRPVADLASGSVQGAVEVARSLGPVRGAGLRESAATAFVDGLNLAAGVSTAVCLLVATVVAVGLGRRSRRG